MIDFDREWNRTRDQIDRQRRFIKAMMVVKALLFGAVLGTIVWLGVTIVRAGPEGIAQAAGHAVSAFERARNGQ